MDSLVIHGRTRYPSDRPWEEDNPPTIDRNIAKTLLSLDGQLHSRHVSRQSSVPTAASLGRATTRFVQMFNDLAKTYALPELNALSEPYLGKAEQFAQTPKPPPSGKRGLWRKLVRSASSHNLPEPPRLVRKTSLSHLLGRQPKLSLNCQSLDDFSHYGGISVLRLPATYRAFDLEIPTCLAATGNYLVEHGQDAAGVFRIPGQTNIVTALYRYYTSQIHEACQTREQIHASIGSTNLPADITCGVHDVASTFKKILWDLPGGILGSVELFRALQNVKTSSCNADVNARLCALAILSLMSNRRIAIICAVFGLLALIKHDPDRLSRTPVTPTRHLGPESMSSRALGLIFAPTLLGSLSEKIALNASASQDVPAGPQLNVEHNRRAFKNAFRTPKHRKSNSTDRPPEMDVSIQRNNFAAGVTEMLIRGWEEIAAQIRLLEPTADTGRMSQLSTDLEKPIAEPKGENALESWAPVCSTSDAMPQNYLQVPMGARSISLIEMPQRPPPNAMQERLPVIDNSSQEDALVRYPKLIPGTPSRGDSKADSPKTSDENMPWWSRKPVHALKAQSKPDIIQNDMLRFASDSTTLFTPLEEHDSLESAKPSLTAPQSISWDCGSQNKPDCISNEDGSVIGEEVNEASCLETKGGIEPLERKFLTAKARRSSDSLTPLMDSGIEISCHDDAVGTKQEVKHEYNELECRPVLPPKVPVSRTSCKISPSQSSARRSLLDSYDTSNMTDGGSSSSGAFIKSTRQRLHTAFVPSEYDRIGDAAPLHMSPSLIPRPVGESGRARRSLTGSPRTKASKRGKRQPLLRASHSSMSATESVRQRMQGGNPDQATLHPMRQQFQGLHIKTEPPPRTHYMPLLYPKDLREGTVARQINFDNRAIGNIDSRHAQCVERGTWERQPYHHYSDNVGTLYAEIRSLSERLNQAQREIAEWRRRAERAENTQQGTRENGRQRQNYQY